MARIAVLGCGRIGRIMPTLLPPIRAQPAGVFNVHRPFMEAIAGHHDVPAFASAQDAFASGSVDCIINDARPRSGLNMAARRLF